MAGRKIVRRLPLLVISIRPVCTASAVMNFSSDTRRTNRLNVKSEPLVFLALGGVDCLERLYAGVISLSLGTEAERSKSTG